MVETPVTEVKEPETKEEPETEDSTETKPEEPVEEPAEEPKAEDQPQEADDTKEETDATTEENTQDGTTDQPLSEPEFVIPEGYTEESWNNQHDLCDYVMDFLNTDEEVNPVLAGYFSKLITQLLNTKSAPLIAYLFDETNNYVINFVKHSYNRSISDVLLLVLRHASNVIDEEIKEKFTAAKRLIVEQIISNLKSDRVEL